MLKINAAHFPYCTKGSSTFIPMKLVIKVGTIRIRFKIESRLIELFKSLLVTEIKVFVAPIRIFW